MRCRREEFFIRTDTGHREMQNDISEWEAKAGEQQHKVAQVRSLCAGKSKLHGRICHTGHTEVRRKLQSVTKYYEIKSFM